jgi:probable F420-dependent oxidoreductase
VSAFAPGQLQVVAPFWLDRPDAEVLDIAVAAHGCGFDTFWVGEMATFDAFALATAIGTRTPGLNLRIGPLAVGVRSPVALALGLSTVAQMISGRVDLSLGASSPAIVSGWHDRPWDHAASRMREAVPVIRALLEGEGGDVAGEHVRSRGFRLRHPLPGTRISVAAFGPAMTVVAAELADEVILNLVTPEHVARVRGEIDRRAAAVSRPAPRLAVWVTVALDPGPSAIGQMTSQIAAYLRPPGYGELFAELGFGELVRRARAGTRRAELAHDIPVELLEVVCALGSAEQISDRLAAYVDAGADHIGIVPATADDPAGRNVLSALRPRCAHRRRHRTTS